MARSEPAHIVALDNVCRDAIDRIQTTQLNVRHVFDEHITAYMTAKIAMDAAFYEHVKAHRDLDLAEHAIEKLGYAKVVVTPEFAPYNRSREIEDACTRAGIKKP